MLPTIPTVNFVISKHQPDSFIYFHEEFESFSDLLDFVLNDLTEVSDSIKREFYCDDVVKQNDYDQLLRDFAGDHLKQFLGESGYKLSNVVKG